MSRLLIMLSLAALLFSGCTSSHKQAVEQQEKLARLHYQLGVDALGKGMLPKAFDELMESNSLHPNQPDVLDALAYAWLLRGDMVKSEEFYRRSLRIKPQASTQNNYANLLNRLERYEEAGKMARRALDDPRYPNQDLAFINLGDALLGQGRLNEAIRSYSQAQAFNGSNPLPRLKTAHAYARLGRLNEAEMLYKDLLREQEHNRAVTEGLLGILKQQGRLTEARHLLNEFARHASSSRDRAWARHELGQLE